MQVEALTTEEKVYWVKRYCTDYGVSKVLADADDSLWETRPLFAKYINQCLDYLAEISPRKTRTNWQKELEDENDRNFELYGVHQDRWLTTMETLGKINSLESRQQQEATDILMNIYNTPPELLPRTVEFLEVCQQAEIGVRMVTHADKTWTTRKLVWTGLNRFFNMISDVYVVEPRGHKTIESWREAMGHFEASPTSCAGYGDSDRSDINPMNELGIPPERIFKRISVIEWTLHNEAINPRINLVNNPGEILDFMIRQAWANANIGL